MREDLVIVVSSDGTWYENDNSAATKANRVLGMMKNTFSYWSDKIARVVYRMFIKPH